MGDVAARRRPSNFLSSSGDLGALYALEAKLPAAAKGEPSKGH